MGREPPGAKGAARWSMGRIHEGHRIMAAGVLERRPLGAALVRQELAVELGIGHDVRQLQLPPVALHHRLRVAHFAAAVLQEKGGHRALCVLR